MSDPIYEAQAYEIAKMARSISALEAENAKLRELAKRMYAAFRRVFPDGHRLDFEQDMRELGVEVDG